MNYDLEHLQIGEDENSTKFGYVYNLWITFTAKRRKYKPSLGPGCSMTMTAEHRQTLTRVQRQAKPDTRKLMRYLPVQR